MLKHDESKSYNPMQFNKLEMSTVRGEGRALPPGNLKVLGLLDGNR